MRVGGLPFSAWWSDTKRGFGRPVDIGWLVAFRVLFGLSMFVSMLRFIAYGWIDEFFVHPALHFKYWGFAWVDPLPRGLMHALFWVLLLLAFAIIIGFRYRVAATLFVIGFTYLQLIDVATYLNHYYLASLLGLLLAVSPAARACSVDALIERRPRVGTVAACWLYLFRFQVGVVYTFAGIAKAHGDWLVHAQPLRIWLGSETDLPFIGKLFTLPWAPVAMSWAGFLFDTTIVWLLLSKRLRRFAYVVLLAFHTVTSTLFPIGMFPVLMSLAALVFFSPSWPRDVLTFGSRWFGQRPAALPPPMAMPSPAPSASWPAKWTLGLAAAALYCTLQIVIPLRFLAYGGNVLWHEQGLRFSWRVMVREKNGSLTFLVRDKQTGRVRHGSPRTYVTRVQEREISTLPDLILQLAHHIRDDFERRGLGPVEVRASALVSLNGRRLAPLIDPGVDLTSIRDSIAPAAWILPSPVDPPPHTRPI
jgi:vitamin K-dependent gamma-carboxylase